MTHPNFSRQAQRNYNTIMQDIADSNLLQSTLREISGDPDYVFKKVVDGMIISSEYSICS